MRADVLTIPVASDCGRISGRRCRNEQRNSSTPMVRTAKMSLQVYGQPRSTISSLLMTRRLGSSRYGRSRVMQRQSGCVMDGQ